MAKNLVIVESPTKAKTISKFLGKDWDVQSSFGHVRDLPKSDLGIDVDNNFTPKYVIPTKSRKVLNDLKKRAKGKDMIYLATDEDREGEAIAWHLFEALALKPDHSKRIAFHEITESAIKEAINEPREINQDLVDAQQARRILDRLVGYKLSPWLWKKVAKGLSAGRVQSVAVRLVVEREKEILSFVPQEYWKILADFNNDKDTYTANLTHIDNKKIDKFYINSKAKADETVAQLEDRKFYINKIDKKDETKSTPSPLTTSLLQQEANRKHGFSSKQTMMLAQQLYEGIELDGQGSQGLITYMRTDSQNLSTKFISEARDFIKQNFGQDFLPDKAKNYKTKSKNAQEAHEAIRPTNVNYRPEDVKKHLNPNQHKLYKLIWERSLATQMKPAIVAVTDIYINDTDDKYTFGVSGAIIKFPGYLQVYNNYSANTILPECKVKEKLDLSKLDPQQHFTKPPARYSDAGLVRQLEKRGIGRPSTYAPIISTIIDRNYVTREDRRLKPTEIGIMVTDLLAEHFPKIMDYDFTANLEDDLDKIARDEKEWVPVIGEFFNPFIDNLNIKYKEVDNKKIAEETDEVCDKCGQPMVIKFARYGKFLACSNFPDCRNTKNLAGDKAAEVEKTDEKCPECKSGMQIKQGRFGKFLACENYPTCKYTKSMDAETGVTCPECNKGDIVAKRSKRGRIFYACNQYPKCKFALWQKPINEKCPDCKSQLVEDKNNNIHCSNKECQYKKTES